MFEFYRDCTFEAQNSFNWIQLLTPLITIIGLWIAYKNLKGVSRTQSVQAHMNLITLENEVRKNSENFRMSSNKYDLTTDTYKNIVELDVKPQEYIKPPTELEFKLLIEARNNAFVLYVTSVDKLASLVNTDYLKKQFQNRDWKTEYRDIFDDARIYFEGYNMVISGKSQMIRNITVLLDIWDKENLENAKKLPKTPPNPTVIDSLPNT